MSLHRDLGLYAAPGRLEADVCVVGAGPAGQSVARALADRGRHVILLESGGFDFDAAVQDLCRGDVVGEDYYDLHRSRLRMFGGTTAIWGGRTCRLDPIDFEKRPWVPLSGWPFDATELEPYYQEAEAHLGLISSHLEQHILDRLSNAPPFARDRITASYWQFDHHIDRFTSAYRRDLLDHPRITVVTNATVREVVLNPAGTAVERLEISNLQSQMLSLSPKVAVLACGGIENARLLLASNSLQQMGIGNQRGWVGRCFMEHVHCRGGEILTDRPLQVLRMGAMLRIEGSRFAPAWRVGEDTQRAAQGLNLSFTINVRKPPGASLGAFNRGFNFMRHSLAAPNEFWRRAWYTTKHAGVRAQEVLDPIRPWLLTKTSNRRIYAVVRSEQSPNESSRVRLDFARRDQLNMPVVQLDWRLNDLDKHAVRVSMLALNAELDRLGLGGVALAPWLADARKTWEFDPLISKNPIAGYHHMGTTRISETPETGVVDPNGRVHGISNLYVAGSSLFPTAGWANPTLTIMALSLRLAHHLAPS